MQSAVGNGNQSLKDNSSGKDKIIPPGDVSIGTNSKRHQHQAKHRQHTGERHGKREENAEEARSFQLKLTNGEPLEQLRWVPLGSNWPNGGLPKPGVVVIQRRNGQALLS